MDHLIGSVDIDAIVDRIDVDAIVDRVDVNEVVQRVDVDAVVEQTELGTIVARSTSGFASEALDAARTQAVDVDDIVTRVVNRVMRRRAGRPAARARAGRPRSRRRAAAGARSRDPQRARDSDRALAHQGHYAGPVSRLLAFLADAAFVSILYTAARRARRGGDRRHDALDARLLQGQLAHPAPVLRLVGHLPRQRVAAAVEVAGHGAARPADRPRGRLGARPAPRADPARSAFPLGFLTFGAGFLGIIFSKRRKAIYDRIADTAVVYQWDAESAKIRELARSARRARRRGAPPSSRGRAGSVRGLNEALEAHDAAVALDLGDEAVVQQQVDVAEHLAQREVRLRDGDVAPHRLRDLERGARLLGDQPVDAAPRAARAGGRARRSARRAR